MAKPLIGITVDFVPEPGNARTGGGKLQLNANYAQAIADSGGVPILIPPYADVVELADMLDGLLIPGGNDIDASNWGEANHAAVEKIAQERFESEKKLFNAISPEMPVLGICYGCQFINVVRGGSLIQHLPDVEGTADHTSGPVQHYKLDRDSKLAEVFGSDAEGQSWHHQAIGKTGEGLRIVAKSDDGVVEAVEADDRPWLVGVQWHPERTFDDPKTRKLFSAFVAAAEAYHEHKKSTVGVW